MELKNPSRESPTAIREIVQQAQVTMDLSPEETCYFDKNLRSVTVPIPTLCSYFADFLSLTDWVDLIKSFLNINFKSKQWSVFQWDEIVGKLTSSESVTDLEEKIRRVFEYIIRHLLYLNPQAIIAGYGQKKALVSRGPEPSVQRKFEKLLRDEGFPSMTGLRGISRNPEAVRLDQVHQADVQVRWSTAFKDCKRESSGKCATHQVGVVRRDVPLGRQTLCSWNQMAACEFEPGDDHPEMLKLDRFLLAFASMSTGQTKHDLKSATDPRASATENHG
jgi:hypothetical protein